MAQTGRRNERADDGPELEPYGYPLRIDGWEFKAVPHSWVSHGRYRTILEKRSRYLATSATYSQEFDLIQVRYIRPDGPGVIRVSYDVGVQSGSKYPKALEAGKFDNVVTDRFAAPRGTVRLGERVRLLELHRDYLVREGFDVDEIERRAGGEGK